MKQTIKQTKRKFYNKWLYKISLELGGASILRSYSLEESIAKTSKSDVKIVASILSNYDPALYSKRVESSILDVYTNNKEIFDVLYNRCHNLVRLAYAPNNNVTIDSNTIIAKKLPHDRYRFKVFLQPHNIVSIDEKEQYLNWLETQKPRINITDTVKTWFHETRWNWDRRYMYVEDEQTLLLIKLRKPEAIGTVYSYTIADK